MNVWWQSLRPKLTILYVGIAILLLLFSGAGHLRLLNEVGKVFGGFTWDIDSDNRDGTDKVVIISIPPQLPSFAISADSVSNSTHITAVNGQKGSAGIEQAYKRARPNDPMTYTVETNNKPLYTVTRPAVVFTTDMWWQTFGFPFIAGMSWLIVGAFLLATATEWTGAVEGIPMIPPAMLLLLYSHWGNIQTAYPADLVVQLLWIPSFALLGAAFIHLSLNYRPEAMSSIRMPSLAIDGLPYLPLVALLGYECGSLLLTGHVPVRTNILLSLGYGVVGGIISFSIGVTSLLRIGTGLPFRKRGSSKSVAIPLRVRHYIGDLLTLWIGGVGLGFCLGVLPILLTGQTLLPLPIFFTLATVYPFLLLYAIRSLRLISRLHTTLDQKEDALHEQQRTAEVLRKTNAELQQATSLLLHADAHLRSILSQRIHDQPKQQALRIRSLLGHWQHKLRLEAERDPDGKATVQPIIEALGKVRKISEDLEGDLRGLQLLVEDTYQRKSLGLKLHLEKLLREDLPMLHPESPLKVQADLWALDALSPDLEQTVEGERIAEAVSYAVTQALLNIYNHAGATFATVRTSFNNDILEVLVTDDGRGFDADNIPLEKTSLFKARLKAREAGGSLMISSTIRPQAGHGTVVSLRVPLPQSEEPEPDTRAIFEPEVHNI
jgi:signal transduction histidine kinase